MGMLDGTEDKPVALLQIPLRVTEDDVLSVACGFLPWENHGSSYWAEMEEVPIPGVKASSDISSEAFATGTINFRIVDHLTDDKDNEHVVSREMLLEGIRRWIPLRERWFEASEVDAADSDDILQCAIFGKIIYG